EPWPPSAFVREPVLRRREGRERRREKSVSHAWRILTGAVITGTRKDNARESPRARSVFERDPETFRHAIQRAAIDTHDLGGARACAPYCGQRVLEITTLEIVQCGEIGEGVSGVVIAAENRFRKITRLDE